MKLNVKEYVIKNKEILKKEISESGLKPKLTIIKNNNDPRGVGLLTRLTLLQHVWNYYKK